MGCGTFRVTHTSMAKFNSCQSLPKEDFASHRPAALFLTENMELLSEKHHLPQEFLVEAREMVKIPR
jgi:hypothetical protein